MLRKRLNDKPEKRVGRGHLKGEVKVEVCCGGKKLPGGEREYLAYNSNGWVYKVREGGNCSRRKEAVLCVEWVDVKTKSERETNLQLRIVCQLCFPKIHL